MIAGSRAIVAGAGVPIEVLLFTPTQPAAAVVLLHGWNGSAQDLATPAQQLAEAGYLALSVSMRGWGGSGGDDDCGLEQPDDVTAVLRWLASERPDVAPRIGLLGISQGGQVALLCAARGAPASAVAAWAPVTDVARWKVTTEHPGIPAYVDRACADGDLARRSPLASAGAIRVPVLLVHGGADTRVPTAQSRLLHDAVRQAGGRSRLEVLEGVGHHRGHDGNARAFGVTTAFFAEHLRGADGTYHRPVAATYGVFCPECNEVFGTSESLDDAKEVAELHCETSGHDCKTNPIQTTGDPSSRPE